MCLPACLSIVGLRAFLTLRIVHSKSVLTGTSRPSYTKGVVVCRSCVTTYFVLIGYRQCSELGRLVVIACTSMGLLTRESSLRAAV